MSDVPLSLPEKGLSPRKGDARARRETNLAVVDEDLQSCRLPPSEERRFMELRELSGFDLGSRSIRYSDRDVMLYALAVLAPPYRLDLVYENNLRVLPTFALTLGLWAVESAGELGAYDPKLSLHVAQRLHMKRSLPREGSMDSAGRVGDVIDKGKATSIDVMVESDYFSAVYTIYLPGVGNWGGRRSQLLVHRSRLNGRSRRPYTYEMTKRRFTG